MRCFFKLQRIGLSQNNIGGLDATRFQILCNALSNCAQLKNLELMGNSLDNLNDLNFETFCIMLAHVEGMSLAANDFSSLSPARFQRFCKALSGCKNLKTFDFAEHNLNRLDDKNFKEFCLTLSECVNLQELDLGGCNIGALSPERLQLLARALSELTNLRTLSLSHNDLQLLHEETFNTLFDPLITLPHFKSLNLGDNRLDSLDSVRLQTLKNKIIALPNLEKLKLDGNYIGQFDAVCLALLCDMFLKCPKLSILDLSLNELERLSKANFNKLMDTLAKIQFLLTLDLGENELETLEADCIQTLCDTLPQCYQLQVLRLSGSDLKELNEQRFKALCNAFLQCNNLQRLSIYHTGLNEVNEENTSRFQILCNAFLEGGTITEIVFEGGPFTGIGLGSLHAEYQKMLKEILLRNKDMNGGFQERLNRDMPPKTLPPAIQHIIVGYVLPFYAFSMLRNLKTMSFALENKLNEETKETKENHDGFGETLFKPLLASCEQREIPIEVIQALLEQGSNPNDTLVKYNEGMSGGRLLEAGGYAFSCVDLAILNGRDDILRLFINHLRHPLTPETLQAALHTGLSAQQNNAIQFIQQALDATPVPSEIGQRVLHQILALENALKNPWNKEQTEAITMTIIGLRTNIELNPFDIKKIQGELNRVLHSYGNGSAEKITTSNLDRIRRCITAYELTQINADDEFDNAAEEPEAMVFHVNKSMSNAPVPPVSPVAEEGDPLHEGNTSNGVIDKQPTKLGFK